MTAERAKGVIVTAGGYLYVLGGSGSCNSPTNSVERAAVSGDGALGDWERTASMWSGRSDFAAVVVGQQIYALGGMGNIRTVEYAPARTRLNHSLFLPVFANVSPSVFGESQLVVCALPRTNGYDSPDQTRRNFRSDTRPPGSGLLKAYAK